jgi:integrase
VSASNPIRSRVTHRGRVVPNLYQRTRADGTVVFEHFGRINGGKPRRVILDATNTTEAVEALETLRSGVRERRIVIASNRRTLVREAVPQYLAYLDSLSGTRREKSPRSIEDITTKLANYIEPALGHRPVSAVTEQEIRDLALSVKGKSRSTVANVLSTASGFFKWAKREKLTGVNPVSVARDVFGEELLPDTEPKQPRALSDGEIARAMEHLSDRFLPIVSLTAETGLRISEVLGLRVASFDADAVTLTVDAQLAKDGSVRKTKTKRERTIPVSAKAAAVIRQQIERLADEGYRGDGEALIFVTKSGRPQSRRKRLARMAERTAGGRSRGRLSALAPSLLRLAARGAQRARGVRQRTCRACSRADDCRCLHARSRRTRRARREAPRGAGLAAQPECNAVLRASQRGPRDRPLAFFAAGLVTDPGNSGSQMPSDEGS